LALGTSATEKNMADLQCLTSMKNIKKEIFQQVITGVRFNLLTEE
jgi:hypothetical protein